MSKCEEKDEALFDCGDGSSKCGKTFKDACEVYTLNKPCEDQRSFNSAVYNALKYITKEQALENSKGLFFYFIIHFVFLVWGIMLAIKSQPKENRVLHILLAFIFAPFYVMAYYLDKSS